MDLDSRYIMAPALEQFYIDKSSGLPLANGKITFYKDNQRTILKNIYTLSGSPPIYRYIALPNPLRLSAVGTIQDANGNNVLPFYFPYDEEGNVELYYVTVENERGQLQFTREGWPSLSIAQNKAEENENNYIPNGQFLIHNNIPVKDKKVAGEITQAKTTLAPGGWTFHRSEQSTARDLVFFERFGSSISNPSAYPRYAIRIENQLPNPGDLVKDLRINFRNVNCFASNTEVYTFSFAGQTNTGNDLKITLLMIKNFGQGGSPIEEKIINTVTISASYSMLTIPFIFGENTNKTLGLNDDDEVSIALRFPINSVFDVSLTDFCLTSGNKSIQNYPRMTQSDVISLSVAGSLPIPNADGLDQYLPIVYTQSGFTFYDGDVGKLYSAAYPNPSKGELLCDGARYLRADISKDEIPYSRLAKKLWDEQLTYYRYGTGASFVTAVLGSQKNRIRLTTNQSGAAIASSAGTSGFTVNTEITGNHYDLQAFIGKDPKKISCQGTVIGSTPLAYAKTSGFTITDLRNSAAGKHLFQIECTDVKNLAGKWLQFSTTNMTYYVWFTVDGQGEDPKPASLTGVKLTLSSTQTADDVALYLAETLSGHQMTVVQTLTASQIKTGSYWTFATSTPENFYVWYRKNKQANDPKSGGTGIVVDIQETDTAEQVNAKTIIAINQAYFAVPDLRGTFLRGWDKEAKLDTGDRFFPYGQGLIKNHIGSFELDELLTHNHSYTTGFEDPPRGKEVMTEKCYHGTYPSSAYVDYHGGNESRPFNSSVNFVIKY
ncbi:MAG: hypothetical protein K0U16_02160 [Gammaproteobacteria bacterium]|nr:hypothetical protein [Gammaproteobacteria bacterium]